ncbi:hypothetical protein ACHAXN_005684 [Cyclotella atomus]
MPRIHNPGGSTGHHSQHTKAATVIRPLPKSSLDNVHFGTGSFSVGQRSRQLPSEDPSTARWLFRRCAHGGNDGLALALRILGVVRLHGEDEDEADDARMQRALFAVVRKAASAGCDGQLDLDLVFEVCQRRSELLKDTFEEELRRAAEVEGGYRESELKVAAESEANGVCLEAAADQNSGAAAEANRCQAINEQTTSRQPNVDVQSTAAAWKKPRSRHKRRSKEDAAASESAAAEGQMKIDSASSSQPAQEQEKSDTVKQSALSTDKLDKSILNSAQSTASSDDNFIGDVQIPTSVTGINSPNENHQNNLLSTSDNLGIFTLPNIFQSTKKTFSALPTVASSATITTAKKSHSTLPTSSANLPKTNEFTSNDLEMEDVHWSFEPAHDKLMKLKETTSVSPDGRVTRSMDHNLANCENDEDAKDKDEGSVGGDALSGNDDNVALSLKSSGKGEQVLDDADAVSSPSRRSRNSPIKQSTDTLDATSSPSRRSARSPNRQSTGTLDAVASPSRRSARSPNRQSTVASPSRRSTRSSPLKVTTATMPSNKSTHFDDVCEGVLQKDIAAASPSKSTPNAKSPSPNKTGRSAVKSVKFDEPPQHETPTVPNLSSVLKPKSRSSPRRNDKSNETELDRTSDSSHSAVNRPRRKRTDRRGSVRVMFTGFNPTQRHKEMLQSLGAELIESVEDAASATHIIVSDGKSKFRRTPKLMICISRVSKILNDEWLEQSSRQQQLLETADYLHINDTEAENRYNFSMTKTIQNGIHARRDRGGVLGGKWVYICRGVAGNQAPSAKELKLIIEAAGGTLLRSLDSSDDFDPSQTVILTSDPRTQSQLNENGVEEQMRNGACAFTTSWLFHTIITQQLTRMDDDRNKARARRDHTSSKLKSPTKSQLKSPQVSSLVRCNSHESLVSTLTASPMKRVERRKRTANEPGDASVCSTSSRGSRVSNLEYANATSPTKKRRAEVQTSKSLEAVSEQCNNFLTRNQFMSEFSPSTEPFTKDTAVIQTHTLWLNYFKDFGSRSSTPKPSRAGKGVRCRRGRKNSLSPLVTCTSNPDMVTPAATPKVKNKARQKPYILPSVSTSLPEHHEHVSWEAYVLFTLGTRAASLDKSRKAESSVPVESYFPKPASIGLTKNELSLSVGFTKEHLDETNQLIFGTLQDLFDLHRKHQHGPIHESVVAHLTVQALEAVSAMHACRVAHNDLSLDSFLIVRSRSDDDGDSEYGWHIQLIGFGYNSIVLECQEQDSISCNEDHFGHDYNCLANVIHLLLTGGMPIAVTEVFGQMEFTTKTFLKSNLFLRGALSWCALLDALMCTGDNDFDSNPIRIEHPLDMFDVKACDTYPKCRKNQISWSCRMLHEISSTNISLASFLKSLCRYNPRFLLSNVQLTTFSYSATTSRHSFILCQPPKAPASSYPGTKDSDRLQAHFSERERALAHREATFHSQLPSIQDALQENRALRDSNIEAERRIRQKEGDIIRREERVVTELRNIQKLKEELLARERLLELRIQGNSNDSPSDDESIFDNQQSPCHSTEARSSVYSEVEEYSTSGGKKRRKRKDCSVSTTPNRQSSIHVQPSTSKASEHLCSLQNLDSPAFKGMRGSSSSITKARKKLNNTPGGSIKSKRTPKKVFIDMNVDD